MVDWLTNPEMWMALGTLILLEIVLGIDNIIFISILVGRLPENQRALARNLGLSLAMVTRLALLFSLSWVMGLTHGWFTVFGEEISGRDIILIGGGLFLLTKATQEINTALEGEEEPERSGTATTLGVILVQIALLDIIFSLDSVITAVGLVQHLAIMALAIVISVIVMLFAAKTIGDFVDAHPSIKMLALSFLILVGTTLIAEGLDFHVPKGYIYFSMAFSVAVESLNLLMRKRRGEALKLHKSINPDEIL